MLYINPSLLASNLPVHLNFLAFAIPCLIAGVAILFVQEKYGRMTSLKEPHKVEEEHAPIA